MSETQNEVPTYNRLVALCEEKGVDLKKAVALAGVSRPTIENWSKKEPQSFQMLNNIEQAIDQLSSISNGS